MNSNDLYKKQEKELYKFHHKLLLADLLYLNWEHSTYEYEKVTPEDLLKKVIKGTKYNGLEQLEILEEAKQLVKIKYNKYFSSK